MRADRSQPDLTLGERKSPLLLPQQGGRSGAADTVLRESYRTSFTGSDHHTGEPPLVPRQQGAPELRTKAQPPSARALRCDVRSAMSPAARRLLSDPQPQAEHRPGPAPRPAPLRPRPAPGSHLAAARGGFTARRLLGAEASRRGRCAEHCPITRRLRPDPSARAAPQPQVAGESVHPLRRRPRPRRPSRDASRLTSDPATHPPRGPPLSPPRQARGAPAAVREPPERRPSSAPGARAGRRPFASPPRGGPGGGLAVAAVTGGDSR